MSLLACQHDSYQTTLEARVVRVEDDGPDGVIVVLDDTILYVEGGGQPSDAGSLDGQPVRGLSRVADGIAHRVATPPAGGTVALALDWARRFDHMQQHTAQHLLSALAEQRWQAPTQSFHLLPTECDIELGRTLSPTDEAALFEQANAVVRAAHPVFAREAAPGDVARSRGLPDGHEGPVRLVSIEGVDLNACGGTHVANTAELQAIVPLQSQRHKGGTRLRFLAGGRAAARLVADHGHILALSRALSVGPAEHLDAIARLANDAKAARREVAELQDELAEHLGRTLAASGARHLHRPDADLRFLGAIARAAGAARETAAPGAQGARPAGATDPVCLLTGGGVFLLFGPGAEVAALGPRVAAALDGRGGGGGGRFQGKSGPGADLDLACSHLA